MFHWSRLFRLKNETFILYLAHLEYTEKPDGQCKLSGKLANFIFWVSSNNMNISFSSAADYFHGSWVLTSPSPSPKSKPKESQSQVDSKRENTDESNMFEENIIKEIF